jgi:uncharacterized protein YjbI with pentapeptide repeats
MNKITKEQVLANIEEVKKYISEAENKVEEKVVGIAIKNRFTGSIIFQSTKTTYKEAIIEKGGADLSGADLCGADLSGADLCGADLCGADLSGADLSGADLCDADLCDAKLSGAELQNVHFYGRGGTKELKRSQLPNFLGALGFVIID